MPRKESIGTITARHYRQPQSLRRKTINFTLIIDCDHCCVCVGCWVHNLPPLSSSRSIRTRNSRATPQCCICRCIIEWGGGRRAIECAPNCTLWSAINGNETMVVRLRVDTLTGRTSVRHPAIRGDRGGWLGWIDCKYASHVASLCRCVQCLNVAKPRSPLKRNRPHHWIENRLRFFRREGMVGTRKKNKRSQCLGLLFC